MDRARWSRRRFVASVGGAVGAFTLGGAASPVVRAASLPHVEASDPTARALHYTEDASKINAAQDPTHRAGTRCATCKLYQGTANAAYGPCQLFPGKAVSSNGWCMGYQQKT
jgi:High potential iron-sulfur protein